MSDKPELTIKEALASLEEELNITLPIGATNLPPAIRFRSVLMYLKERLCPHKVQIRAHVDSDGSELATVIADTLLSALASIPLPVATVAKRLAMIGLDRFCDEPESLLD